MAKHKSSYNSLDKSANSSGVKLARVIILLCILGALLKHMAPSFSLYMQTRHFNQIRKTTEAIFEKEMEYFNKRGHFTADLKKIDLPLPPQDEKAPNEYERPHYEYDENQGYFYVREELMYYTKSGDHYWITISEEQPSDTSKYPPMNYFSITGFGKNLPAAFNKAYGYGKEYERQFNRPRSPEIEYLCYSVGEKSQPERASQICQKSGLLYYTIVTESPSSK